MNCKTCKVKCRCTESRVEPDNGLRYRVYKCFKCGLQIYTKEIECGEVETRRAYNDLKAYRERLQAYHLLTQK